MKQLVGKKFEAALAMAPLRALLLSGKASAASPVGVVSAKSSGSGVEGLAFAIPFNTVGEIAGELTEKKTE